LLFIVHVLGQISGDIFIRLYKTCTPLIANCLLMQCISDSYPQRVVVFKSGAKIVFFFQSPNYQCITSNSETNILVCYQNIMYKLDFFW